MRHVAGTGRVGRDREHVIDLAPASACAPTAFERVLHLQTPAGRVSLGVERVSQPFDTSERIRSARWPAPRRPATSRRWPRSTASGTWCSTCARSPAAARMPPSRRRARPGGRRRDAVHSGPARALARRAALGHLVVFSAETVAGRGASAGLRAQRGTGRRGHLRPRDRADPDGAAARARPLRLARPPAASSSTCRRG